MVKVDLKKLAQDYYGSKHYLFAILKRNGITLPKSFIGGEIIKLPVRGPNARLQLAKRLQGELTSVV